jgi:hypothetical protein
MKDTALPPPPFGLVCLCLFERIGPQAVNFSAAAAQQRRPPATHVQLKQAPSVTTAKKKTPRCIDDLK